MKYLIKVIQWNQVIIDQESFDTLKECYAFLNTTYKRNLGQKQHYKNNCLVNIQKLNSRQQNSINNKVHIPKILLSYENYLIKEYNTLKFIKFWA